MTHGAIRSKMLVKQGKQVQKFWKHNGYGASERDLEQCRGVELHTQYDGVLYAPRHLFYEHGIAHEYNGEKQLILPMEYWEILNKRRMY